MQLSMCSFVLVALSCAGLFAPVESVTPVQKVVQLLNGMIEKGKAEKHKEEVEYADFKVFCDDHIKQEQRDVQQEKQHMEVLSADILKESSQSKKLGKRIGEDDSSINAAEGDIQAAEKVRQNEENDYRSTHKDYEESIDSLRRAIKVMKKQDYDRKQASFVQLSSVKELKLIPAHAKRKIDLFLMQRDAEDSELEAPEADAYESQSGGIIEMLENLLDKFIEEKTTLEKEEANAKHAFQMLKQDLKARIDLADKDRDESSETKGKVLHEKAGDKDEMEKESVMKKADSSDLSDLQAQCGQRATEFESRQQLRAEEIEALEKAVEIMTGDAINTGSQSLPGALVQTDTALAQLRADSQRSPSQQRVVTYLQQRAGQLNSRLLSAMASRANSDPFGKVKKMIKDLVVRLMEEANEEAEHKGWCDKELTSNQQTREEKTTEVETLRAEIDEHEASIAKLTEDIGNLSEEVSQITAAMAEATKLREEEKADNRQTMADAKAAGQATAQAITVLKEFYEQAGEATAFLQIRQEPYQGMGAESGGVVGMLEVIESDFARLDADTEAGESSAQKAYDEFMSKSTQNKAVKQQTIEHSEGKKQDQEQELATQKSDLEGSEKELDAAMAYFDKLKPSCMDSGESYEDRVARRKEEVESLQEALKILNGEEIA